MRRLLRGGGRGGGRRWEGGRDEGTRERRVGGAEGVRETTNEEGGGYETPRRREEAGTPGEGSGGRGKGSSLRGARFAEGSRTKDASRGKNASTMCSFSSSPGGNFITDANSRERSAPSPSQRARDGATAMIGDANRRLRWTRNTRDGRLVACRRRRARRRRLIGVVPVFHVTRARRLAYPP